MQLYLLKYKAKKRVPGLYRGLRTQIYSYKAYNHMIVCNKYPRLSILVLFDGLLYNRQSERL